MFKDNKLRLLMTLAGIERLGVEDEPGVTWIIPSTIPARELHETHEMIEKHRNNPVTEYGEEGNSKTAEDMLRRAPADKKRRVEYDDDSGGDDGFISEDDYNFLYAPGGPTPMEKRADALDHLKKKRRNRRNKGGDEDVLSDDEARQAKRKAKLAAEKEKMRRMKSKLMVGDSDEESNEEEDRAFFAGEEALRRAQAEKALEALTAGELNGITSTLQVKESKKRKSGADNDLGGGGRRKKKKQVNADSDDGHAAPASSSSPESRQVNNLAGLDLDSNDENDDDDMNDFALEKKQARIKPAAAIDIDSETTNDDVDALLPSSKRQRPASMAEDDETEGEAALRSTRSRRPAAKRNGLAALYSDDDGDDDDDDDMNDHSLERSKPAKPTTHDIDSDSSNAILAHVPSPQKVKPHNLPTLHIDAEKEILTPSSSLQRQKPSKFTLSNLDSDDDMNENTSLDKNPTRRKSPNPPPKTRTTTKTTTIKTTVDLDSSPRRHRHHGYRRSDSEMSGPSKPAEPRIITPTNDEDEDEDDEMDAPPPTAAASRRRRRGKVAGLSSDSE